jgi:prolyl oligopeptidase
MGVLEISDGRPVLLQVNFDSGHGAEAKNVLYRNFANMYAFALWQAGNKDFQPDEQISR